MDKNKLTFEITQLIGLKQEGEYWDFKREWHKNKSDLLHDIICLANNLTGHNGYISQKTPIDIILKKSLIFYRQKNLPDILGQKHMLKLYILKIIISMYS